MENYDIATDFEHLYQSALKCQRSVAWKDSTAHFMLNIADEVNKLYESIRDGTYTPRKPKVFKITTPKEREIMSIAFNDRVYQRSLNDNILYPIMTKSLIYDNCACQKGKGTDFARNRLKKHMRNFYRQHKSGFVLQIDIHKYYPSMSHELVEKMFKEKLDSKTFSAIKFILNNQYKNDREYNPGSQLIQIAGICYLDKLDHFCKEKLKLKHYVRYMDDIIIIHEDKEYLEYCKNRIKEELDKLQLEFNPKKTKIYNLDNGIEFLGFKFRLTNTGKIIMTIKKDSIIREKRHLRNLVRTCKHGKITKEKVDECFQSILNHISKGNTYYYRQKFKNFYNELWGDANEDYKR